VSLRLNPEDNKDLIDYLSSIIDFATIPKENKLSNLTATMNTLQEKSHQLLKEEWERVKKGEKVYRAIKYIFGTIAFVFMIYFTYNVYKITQVVPELNIEHNKTLERNSLP
ncbi:MAG: hypothetical protein U9N59_07765, partial [Campylobacterota bacterium]|nr:hypothetical protein [Campylobacterota bacterium]